MCTRGTGRTRKAETRIFKLQRGRFSTQSWRRKCGVFLIFSLGPMHPPCDVLRTVACTSSIPQRGLHRAGGANSACGRDAGWGAGEAPRPLLTFDPQLTEGFGGRRPGRGGAWPLLLSQGELRRGEGGRLPVGASAVVTRGLRGAQCNGCRGNCCAWSGVTS